MKTCGQCSIVYPDALEYCPRDGNKLPPAPGETRAMYDPLLGTTIDGRYIVESLLGQGGMGFVYACRHAIIDKRVAIKVLRQEAARDETSAQRFIAEAKAASRIGHQNIVDITDFGVMPATPGQSGGHAYFVMEFLDGPTLGKVVADLGSLPPLRAIAITVQIARGLHAAHQKGIIHRDLKPENIFVLERDGQSDLVKIVDFGIAKDATSRKKLTQVGMVLGTPEYMSPEQATGQPLDHRVDMYALGCILYEMLTGDVPFKGETSTRTLTMHVFEPVEPPSARRPDLQIPAALEAVVMRMLLKKPTERYADMRELMNELDRVEAELRGTHAPAPIALPTTVPAPAEPAAAAGPELDATDVHDVVPRSQTGMRVAMAAAAAILVGGVVVAVVGRGRPPRNPPKLATPAPAPPAAAPAPAPVPAPPAAVEVTLMLRTSPGGADVYAGAEKLGISPLQLKRARGSDPLAFSFRHAGFRDATREIIPDHDADVEVLLMPRSSKVASSRKPGPAPSLGPATPAATTGRPPVRNAPARMSDLRNPFD